MSISTKEKQREIVIDQPHDLEIVTSTKRYPNGAPAHPTATSVISRNGSSNVAGSDHVDDQAQDDIVTPYSIDMDDPYRYGWRYLTENVDDRIIITGRIPLTLEDLLHPEEEDFRMQNPAHTIACHYLRAVDLKQLDNEPNALILSDTRVDWSVPGIKPFGPDITVIMNGKMEPLDKGTYVSGEDGDQPVMIIEVTSPSTRDQDFDDKPILMQQVGLPYYFVVDLATRNKRVYCYELNSAGHYIGIKPDEQGRVWMRPVSMWLGLNDGRVECFNAQGELMLDYPELARALEDAQLWADEESQRADEEAQRANEEEEKRKIADERAEAAARQAEAASRRAEAAARRADQEAQRRQEAEQRIQAESSRAAEEIEKIQRTREEEMKLFADRLRALGVDPDTILSA